MMELTLTMFGGMFLTMKKENIASRYVSAGAITE